MCTYTLLFYTYTNTHVSVSMEILDDLLQWANIKIILSQE